MGKAIFLISFLLGMPPFHSNAEEMKTLQASITAYERSKICPPPDREPILEAGTYCKKTCDLAWTCHGTIHTDPCYLNGGSRECHQFIVEDKACRDDMIAKNKIIIAYNTIVDACPKGAGDTNNSAKAPSSTKHAVESGTAPAGNGALSSECSADVQSCMSSCINLQESPLITCRKECSQDNGVKGSCFKRFAPEVPGSTSKDPNDLSKRIAAAKDKAANAAKVNERENVRVRIEEQEAVEAKEAEIADAQRRAAEQRRLMQERQARLRAEREQQEDAQEFLNGFVNGFSGAVNSAPQPQYRAPTYARPTVTSPSPSTSYQSQPQTQPRYSPPATTYTPPPPAKFVAPSSPNCSDRSAQACTVQ